MTPSEKSGTHPIERPDTHSLSDCEKGEIRRCDFSGLILGEELMLKGVGQILDEFGCGPDGPGTGDDAAIEMPALALWMLGRVVRNSTEQLLRKLDIATEHLKAAGVPEMLDAKLPMNGKGPSTPVSAGDNRPANGSGKQPVAAAAAQAKG